MGIIEPMSNNPASSQFAVPDQRKGQVEPMSYIPGSENSKVSNNQMGQMEPKMGNMGLQHITPNQKVEEMEAIWKNLGSQTVVLPTKRKAAVEPLCSNSLPQQLSVPNKRVVQMEPLPNSPRLPHPSASNKRSVQMLSISSTPGSHNLPNKRMVRNESISNKSGSQRAQTPKNRSAQAEPSPKAQTESFEAVRSKMRETLAAALSMVCQHQEKASTEEKSSPHEAVNPPLRVDVDSQPMDTTTVLVDAGAQPESTMDIMLKETSVDKSNDSRSTSDETATVESIGNSAQTGKSSGQESQFNYVLPDGDVSFSDSFFVKDELLQGNGLSWAWDVDMEVAEMKEVRTAEKPQLGHVDVGGDGIEQVVSSPQDLAIKIEAELFKLFGGVNKKYKERGRSLVFNLKDRNNPELRERVMSGEISPERLCSMTPEELASKELSEWRMAKAEEMAQMIVLPDSDVDIRRLVKKTHKGEYQVEVDQDDGVSVEVSVGSTSFSQFRPKDKETRAPSSEADGEGERNSSESQDPSCSLTIPSDGTDLMQSLIVDELKDEEFLPPIVSLDEFMESLNSEPPFENLPVDADEKKPPPDKENLETGDESVASDLASTDPVDARRNKADKVDMKSAELELKVKSSESPAEHKTSPSGSASKSEHVWEGELQLNISSLVKVIGLFKSGEKTSTKEWPSSLEIKGRVRLEAFEKFLQELPMSRSRAVMVVHLILKEGSSEHDQTTLSEVVDSYIMEERLGFSDPTPGVEIYFCPPHKRIVEMLSKHISQDQTEIFNSTNNGLIGVVVWRRAHLSSAISPNSSSHHKHSSKKQNISSRRHEERNTNAITNMTSKSPMPFGQPPMNSRLPLPDNDDDDDIPPGFGPGSARDEDDLPEFNFSGNLNSSGQKFYSQGSRMASFHPTQSSLRPVDQMRELVHKYGQTGTSPISRNWQDKRGAMNDDDDDDIPEWQPQVPQQKPHTHPSMQHGFHQPMHPHVVNQQIRGSPVIPMQTQIGVMPNTNPSLQHGAVRFVQPNGGQFYGSVPVIRARKPGNEWRRDAQRS